MVNNAAFDVAPLARSKDCLIILLLTSCRPNNPLGHEDAFPWVHLQICFKIQITENYSIVLCTFKPDSGQSVKVSFRVQKSPQESDLSPCDQVLCGSWCAPVSPP